MTAYKVFVFCTIKKIVKIAQLIINQYIFNKFNLSKIVYIMI